MVTFNQHATNIFRLEGGVETNPPSRGLEYHQLGSISQIGGYRHSRERRFVSRWIPAIYFDLPLSVTLIGFLCAGSLLVITI